MSDFFSTQDQKVSMKIFISCIFICAFIAAISVDVASCSTLQDMMGVNIHFTQAQPGELEMLRDGGWKWVRMDFLWQEIEKTKGIYDWSGYDCLMKDLDANSISPVFILDYGNTNYDDGKPPESPDTIQAFVNWALAGIERYQGKGVLWECWNEPNGSGFWKPKPNAKAYTNLCKAVGAQIQQRFPGEVFMGPAISEMKKGGLLFAIEAFHDGVLDAFDVVSTHGYGNDIPEEWLIHYEEFKIALDHYTPSSRGKLKLVNSEWGYQTLGVSEDKQGMFLARSYLTTVSVGVPVHIWYDWRDDCVNDTWSECHFGTVRHTYNPSHNPPFDPKPAYIANRALANTLGHYTFSHRSLPSLTQPLEQALVFSGNSSSAYAVWTIDDIEKHLTLELPEEQHGMCFNVVDWLGEKAPQVCSKGKELKILVSEGPRYLIPVS